MYTFMAPESDSTARDIGGSRRGTVKADQPPFSQNET